jgi:hypothetical protein
MEIVSYYHQFVFIDVSLTLCSLYAIIANNNIFNMNDWRFSKKTRPKLSAPRKKIRHNLRNIHSKINRTLNNDDIQVSKSLLYMLWAE